MSVDIGDLTPLATWRHFTASTGFGDSDCITTAEYCPARAFTALTLPFPLPSDLAGHSYVVRRLAFTITSHDQGFSGELDHLKGTYDASHTFFEVCIIQPSGQERVRRRVVQRNLHAKWDYTTHHVAWDHRVQHEKPKNAYRGFNLSWEDWLSAIRSGDEIRLIPRANFVSWTNYVQAASIQVWVELVPPQTQTAPTDFSRWNDYLMYRPLDTVNREIRLVELEPSDDDDEVISFVLRYTPLADTKGRLKFNALSYCWGSADEAHPVMIRDDKDRKNVLASVKMSVNRNLYSALRKLRRRQEPQTLWIDLLCIKQSDLKERAHQVELMGEIYSSAHVVYVWLGEGDQWSYEDCEKIQLVEKSYERLLSQACPYDQSSTDVANEKQYGDVDDPKPDLLHPFNTHRQLRVQGELGMCFDQIFELPWFRRVWVLQEVWSRMVSTTSGLATNDTATGGVSVLCGAYELTWGSVVQANLCLESHRQWLQNKIMPRIWSSLFHIERQHLSYKEIESRQPKDIDSITPQLSLKTADRLPILEALLGGLDMEATDPRDKIFAILSFGEETHDIAELPPSARPNYEKTTIEVFSDFTKWWISYHGTLNILSAVHAQPWRTWMDLSPLGVAPREFDHSQRPSWSVWYEGRSEWSLGTLGLLNNRGHDHCASGGTRVDRDLLSGSSTGTLALKGFQVDIIKSKEIYPYSKREPYGDSTRMLAAYEAIFDPTSVLGMWDMTKLNWQQSLAAKLKKDNMLAERPVRVDDGKLRAHLSSHGFYGFRYNGTPDSMGNEDNIDEDEDHWENSDNTGEINEAEVDDRQSEKEGREDCNDEMSDIIGSEDNFDEDDEYWQNPDDTDKTNEAEVEGGDEDRVSTGAGSHAASTDVPTGESGTMDENISNFVQKRTSSSELGVDQVDVPNGITGINDVEPAMDQLRIDLASTTVDGAESYGEQGSENGADSEDYEGEDMDDNSEPEPESPPFEYFPCHGKYLFKTEGDKVGLCPAGAKEGDIIVILYGGNVPYLLRPATNNITDEGRFHLVGECYLDGFMHGEAMELLREDGLGVKEEVFLLI